MNTLKDFSRKLCWRRLSDHAGKSLLNKGLHRINKYLTRWALAVFKDRLLLNPEKCHRFQLLLKKEQFFYQKKKIPNNLKPDIVRKIMNTNLAYLSESWSLKSLFNCMKIRYFIKLREIYARQNQKWYIKKFSNILRRDPVPHKVSRSEN